jgi:hypothetical protein
MNAVRRDRARSVVERLQDISVSIEAILDDEQDALDNMPENLEGSERYSRMEDAVDFLDSAMDLVVSAIDELNNAVAC